MICLGTELRVMKFFYRLFLLSVGVLFLFKVVPSFADVIDALNQTQNMENSEESNSESTSIEVAPNPSTTEEPPAKDDDSGSNSDTHQLNEEKNEDEVLEEDESKKEAVALANQYIITRIPKSVPIDPRSKNYIFSSGIVGGSTYILLCIDGFPTLTSRVNSNSENGILVYGNGTKNFRISGSSWDVQSIISNSSGIRFTSTANLMTDESATLRFIALDKPSISSKLCDSASPENIKILNFRALGINLDIKKGEVILKR